MRQRFQQPPGTSFLGIGLQTMPTRGVEIDNQSGSWLYIPTLETYIPPYTIGWAAIFPYDVTSLDILATTGPAGQRSTSRGSPVVVYLTNGTDMSPASDGEPFIPTVSNPVTLTSVGLATTALVGGTGLQTFVPAQANSAIRLYGATLGYDLLTPSAAGASSPVELIIFRASSGVPIGNLSIAPASPYAPFNWPAQGYDLVFQEAVQYNAIALDTNMNIAFTLIYGIL